MRTLTFAIFCVLRANSLFSQSTWENSGTNDIVNSNSGDVIIGNSSDIKYYGKIYSFAAKSDTPMNGEFIGNNEWWGFRTDTNSAFHFDIYNNNNPKSVFSINQQGQAFFNAGKSDNPMTGEIFGSAKYWGFRTDLNNSFHVDTYNFGNPKSMFSINQGGQVFLNRPKSDTPLQGELYGSSGWWSLRTGTDNSFNVDIYHSNVPTSGLTIHQNGNVGIGTTDPRSFRLAVGGKVGAREVVVTLEDPWPDYVFEDSYMLPSLAQLSQYIIQHKHLPSVPTASDVKEKGVSLGEMNAILLKKVEELTLHLIRQEKEINELKLKVYETN